MALLRRDDGETDQAACRRSALEILAPKYVWKKLCQIARETLRKYAIEVCKRQTIESCT